LCATLSVLAVSPRTVTQVAVIERVTHLLSLPKYTVVFYGVSLRIMKLTDFYPKLFVFPAVCCFERSIFEVHSNFMKC